jgi:hypothetical protein
MCSFYILTVKTKQSESLHECKSKKSIDFYMATNFHY